MLVRFLSFLPDEISHAEVGSHQRDSIGHSDVIFRCLFISLVNLYLFLNIYLDESFVFCAFLLLYLQHLVFCLLVEIKRVHQFWFGEC